MHGAISGGACVILSNTDTIRLDSLPQRFAQMIINYHVKMKGKLIPISHPDAILPVAIADGTKSDSHGSGIDQNEISGVPGFNAK